MVSGVQAVVRFCGQLGRVRVSRSPLSAVWLGMVAGVVFGVAVLD